MSSSGAHASGAKPHRSAGVPSAYTRTRVAYIPANTIKTKYYREGRGERGRQGEREGERIRRESGERARGKERRLEKWKSRGRKGARKE